MLTGLSSATGTETLGSGQKTSLTNCGKVDRFVRCNSGTTAILFAIALLPIVLFVGLAIDFGTAYRRKSDLQLAADSAALSSVAAAAAGSSSAAAADAGLQSWKENTFKMASSGTIADPTINVTIANGAAQATVNFTSSQATSLGRISGTTGIDVAGAATAVSYLTSTISGGFNGKGSVWGDPHVDGADGNGFTFDCTSGWYNLLSDAGLELNASCFKDPTWGLSVIRQFSLKFAGHQVMFELPVWDLTTGLPTTPWNPSVITIDGVDQSQVLGSTVSYLGGQVSYSLQTTDWTQLNQNEVVVTTSQYKIKLNFDYATSDSRPSGGAANVTATGAGVCGTPGGIWGKTLAGVDDAAGQDFSVTGPDATSAEFARSCTPGVLGPHLIQ